MTVIQPSTSAPALLIDPDLLASGGGPRALYGRYATVPTTFGYRDADPTTGPKCPRCGRLEHHHLWQVVHTTGEVLDCHSSQVAA